MRPGGGLAGARVQVCPDRERFEGTNQVPPECSRGITGQPPAGGQSLPLGRRFRLSSRPFRGDIGCTIGSTVRSVQIQTVPTAVRTRSGRIASVDSTRCERTRLCVPELHARRVVCRLIRCGGAFGGRAPGRQHVACRLAWTATFTQFYLDQFGLGPKKWRQSGHRFRRRGPCKLV